jgi:hypothetical protein
MCGVDENHEIIIAWWDILKVDRQRRLANGNCDCAPIMIFQEKNEAVRYKHSPFRATKIIPSVLNRVSSTSNTDMFCKRPVVQVA